MHLAEMQENLFEFIMFRELAWDAEKNPGELWALNCLRSLLEKLSLKYIPHISMDCFLMVRKV